MDIGSFDDLLAAARAAFPSAATTKITACARATRSGWSLAAASWPPSASRLVTTRARA